jgi:hypothetical protein
MSIETKSVDTKSVDTKLMDQFNRFKNEEGTYNMSIEDFTKIIKGNTKLKRPQSAYFIWLNENREAIKSQYFSDFNDIEKTKWDDIEFKSEYYTNQGLKPPEKVGKPKIVALITSKAGIMWKELSDDDKAVYVSKYKENKEMYENSKKYFNS